MVMSNILDLPVRTIGACGRRPVGILGDVIKIPTCAASPLLGPEESQTFGENAKDSGGPADSANPIQEDNNRKINKRMILEKV